MLESERGTQTGLTIQPFVDSLGTAAPLAARISQPQQNNQCQTLDGPKCMPGPFI
jgi:hypothetical protein